jgi:hypothetical protein
MMLDSDLLCAFNAVLVRPRDRINVVLGVIDPRVFLVHAAQGFVVGDRVLLVHIHIRREHVRHDSRSSTYYSV